MTKIDLVQLTKGEVRNLSGHPRGLAARQLFELDRLDQVQGPVVVVVPADLDALTTSFFQGMFAKSLQTLGGRAEFLAHYRFEASQIILRQVDRGIRTLLTRRNSPLELA